MRTKISEFSATPSNNTDIDGIDIAEGCAPSGINNAIRELMSQLKDFQAGSAGDPFNGAVNGTVGATTPSTVVATQVDITGQGDLRLQDTTGGEYVALQAPSSLSSSYTLTLPVDDGTSGQALITDGNGVLSWSSAASGDVYGPSSATDNAIVRYDGTTGKLIQNSAVTIGDDGATVIAANSSSDGLRITQTGAGNALLVEDSANPDATPFVVNSGGSVGIGTTSPAYALQIQRDGTAIAEISRASDNANEPFLYFSKSRGTHASPTIVSSGDFLGTVNFFGYDGAALQRGAQISAVVDGTPGTNDMPGRLVFSTTADGASSPTERMRIGNSGTVGIGAANIAAATLYLNKTLTGGTTTYGVLQSGQIQSDVTTVNYGHLSQLNTQATAFTLANQRYFAAVQGTIGVGSSVTTQAGFFASSNLTGATNNYGFYGEIASGTGRWNLYMAGTAANYLEGATTVNSTLGIKTTASAEYNILVAGNLTGGINAGGMRFQSQIQSDVTSNARGIMSIPSTAAAAFTISNLEHFYAGQGSLGAGSAITSQYGYRAASSLTGATNNYGFYGDIASGTGRYNFYAAGTADNYFAGNVGIGNTAPTAKLNVSGAIHVTGAGSFPSTGVGIEIVPAIAGGDNYIQAYNRTGSTWQNLSITSGQTVFGTSGTERGRISSTGVWSLGAAPGSESLRVTPVASAVNYVQIQGAATGGNPAYLALGSDTNISLYYGTKGTGFHNFATGTGQTQFYVAHTASAVNYLQVTGAATGVAGPTLSAQGSDANIPLLYNAKGTGNHQFTTTNTGNLQFLISHTASAVNYVQVGGGVTGGNPYVQAAGSDTNINLVLSSKGAGGVGLFTNSFGNVQFNVAHTASAVNYLQVTGSATGGNVNLTAQGSDTNIGVDFSSKGTSPFRFFTNGYTTVQMRVVNVASAVNQVDIAGSATGNAVSVSASGSDTNIDLALTPKGSGVLQFGTYTAGVVTQAGYITVKDAAGNTRRLLVG